MYMASYAMREQVIGHIGRVWRDYHETDFIVSEMRRFEEEALPSSSSSDPSSSSSDLKRVEEEEEEEEEGNDKMDLNMLASLSPVGF